MYYMSNLWPVIGKNSGKNIYTILYYGAFRLVEDTDEKGVITQIGN